ncbi:MAG: hypothetical protein ABGY41_21455 [Candidatus Poribacteria bacterium]
MNPTASGIAQYARTESRAVALELYARHGFVEEGRGLRDMKIGPDRYIDTIIMGRLLS